MQEKYMHIFLLGHDGERKSANEKYRWKMFVIESKIIVNY